MKQKSFLPFASLLFILNFAFHGSNAQVSGTDSLLVGTWKGTSVCQVKNSPCRDEVVVYHISKGTEPGLYNIAANKIVNGSEEEMGILSYKFNQGKNELTSTNNNGTWTFRLKQNKLEGTLYYHESLYRIIMVAKE